MSAHNFTDLYKIVGKKKISVSIQDRVLFSVRAPSTWIESLALFNNCHRIKQILIFEITNYDEQLFFFFFFILQQ